MTVQSVSHRTPSGSVPAAMLGLGARGPQVVELQRALSAAGFDPHGFDGYFGPKTLEAVRAFQRSRSLVVDGRVGPQTWGALRPQPTSAPATQPGTLAKGSRGPAVLEVQRLLAAAGFDPHGLDGDFGPKTEAAVRAFQRARGMAADGRVGPQTLEALRGTATAPAQASQPTLREGDVGDQVRTLQTRLQAHGRSPGPIDGQFGPVTRRAVVAFQRAHGLAGSGVVDATTWAALATPPATGPTASTSAGVQGMLDWCRSMIGSPYAAVNPFRFGEVLWDGQPHRSENGSGTVWNYPKGTRVFDCSGFVVAAYRQLGVDLAAHGLYSSGTMATDTRFLQTLSKDQLQPGDLIVYQPHNGIGHVVIYLGNGQTIESAGGSGVKVGTVDWARVRSYKRVPVA